MITGFTFIAERPDWTDKCVKAGMSSPEAIFNNEPLSFAVKEILRICPPIPINIPRIIIKDCVVDGVPLKKGDYLTYPQGGIGMAEEYYHEAEKYIPERYYDTEKIEKKNPKQINIPFGLGKRNCLGKELAWNEVMIYVGKTMEMFDIRTPKGYQRHQLVQFGYRCTNPYVDVKLREGYE